MININSVIQNVPMDDNELIQRKRVILIHPDDDDYAFVVNLEGQGTFPFVVSMTELEIGLEAGTLLLIKDPFARVINDKDISPQLIGSRDKRWEVIQFLWGNNKEGLLNPKKRKALVTEAVIKFSLPKYQIERILKRFWQRGMTKNALLPDYSNCGNKGMERNVSEKKRGRERQKPGVIGINIDEVVRQIFRRVIDKQYRTKKIKKLYPTYVYMLETYFADHYEGKNGEKKAKIWDENSIPTYNQFRYWYLKEYNFKKDFIGRYGELAFNLKHREILDYSTAEVDAPGAIYQIDATVADVYLVSSDNPLKVIGRPVVYIAIDVFSRIVCGLYVGLEGPSWLGAMMLLDNVVEDKIDFCSKYGIEIDEKEWPSKYLPEGIVADNGELEGYNADRLINNLNVPVINKPPYRGDLKGIVERHFRTINDRIKYTSPGAIQKEYRSRSDEDPRLKAEYTLDDFIKYMIIDVLWHNKHINRSYPLPKAMLNEDILPRPVDMWEWGMTRRKGRFNVYDRDIVRLNLLPTTTANITRAGIKFEDRFYSLDTAISEGWFTKGKNIRTQITYDPRNVNHIYLPNENGTGFKVANLLPKSYAYKDLSWEEARFARDSQNENYADAWREELQNDIDRDIATEEINKEAKARLKQAKKNQPEQSVNKRINNIQSNRSDAKQKRRKDEQFPPLGDSTPKEGRVLPFITNDETPETQTSSNKAQNDLMGKLLRKRDSIIGKDKE